jgi:hypothetical protein
MSKQCRTCKLELPLDAFYLRGRNSQKTFCNCKACVGQYMKQKFSGGIADEPGRGALYIAYNSRIPGEIKVGAAKNPHSRLALMERSHNFRLVVHWIWPGMGHLETAVHRVLAPQRVSLGLGREWFACSPEFATAAVKEVVGRHEASRAT